MIQLKVDLRDDHEIRFKLLKEHWKFNSNTETLRYMINFNWEQEINKNRMFVELENALLDDIRKIVERKDVQHNYYMYTINDFVDIAIKKLLEEIKSTHRSLYDWDIRSTLNDEELQVAKTIASLQDSRSSRDFTLKLLLEELDWRNEEKLNKILSNFLENQYLSTNEQDGETIYRAYSP